MKLRAITVTVIALMNILTFFLRPVIVILNPLFNKVLDGA